MCVLSRMTKKNTKRHYRTNNTETFFNSYFRFKLSSMMMPMHTIENTNLDILIKNCQQRNCQDRPNK